MTSSDCKTWCILCIHSVYYILYVTYTNKAFSEFHSRKLNSSENIVSIKKLYFVTKNHTTYSLRASKSNYYERYHKFLKKDLQWTSVLLFFAPEVLPVKSDFLKITSTSFFWLQSMPWPYDHVQTNKKENLNQSPMDINSTG